MNIVLRVLFIDLIKIKMISVILSTNNEIRNNYLEQLLESIKNQDTKYELIIIDN
jgi:glycosyltransferase involved in cell wall biosynthesis